MYEFYTITGLAKNSSFVLMGFLVSALSFVTFFLAVTGLISKDYLSIIVMFPLIAAISIIYDRSEYSLKNFVTAFAGVAYIFIPLILMIYLAFPPVNDHAYTHRIILGILSLIWVHDTFAYLSGITFGRHRLFPRISPKKSWEGFFGGTLITIGVSFWMNTLMGVLSMADWVILAVIVSVFGVYGDLMESFIKRSFHKKDSGSIIPGHGGVLDRIDSILLVMPAAYFYLTIHHM